MTTTAIPATQHEPATRHCGHAADCQNTVCFRGDLTPDAAPGAVLRSVEVCATHLVDALTALQILANNHPAGRTRLTVHAIAPDHAPHAGERLSVADHLLITSFTTTAA